MCLLFIYSVRCFVFFNRTDCCFSPDDKILVTGTSVKKGGGSGKLIFFYRETFQKLYEIEVTDAVCILVLSSLQNMNEIIFICLFSLIQVIIC